MRINVHLLVIAALLPVAAHAENLVVFQNVNVIDAVDGLRKGKTVVVRGNRIAQIGTASSMHIAGNATSVDMVVWGEQ